MAHPLTYLLHSICNGDMFIRLMNTERLKLTEASCHNGQPPGSYSVCVPWHTYRAFIFNYMSMHTIAYMHISHTQIHSTETITEKLAKRNAPFIYIYIHTVKDFLLYSQSVNLEMPSQSQCGPFEMVIM